MSDRTREALHLISGGVDTSVARAHALAALAQAEALERIAASLEQMNDGGTLRVERIG